MKKNRHCAYIQQEEGEEDVEEEDVNRLLENQKLTVIRIPGDVLCFERSIDLHHCLYLLSPPLLTG